MKRRLKAPRIIAAKKKPEKEFSYVTCAAQIDDDLEDGEFRGMAAAFNVVIESFTPTIIQAGAFADTIINDRSRLKILWMHDVDQPLGLPTQLRETDKGLEFRAMISDTELGRDALTLIRDGVVDMVSIGWTPQEFSFKEIADILWKQYGTGEEKELTAI